MGDLLTWILVFVFLVQIGINAATAHRFDVHGRRLKVLERSTVLLDYSVQCTARDSDGAQCMLIPHHEGSHEFPAYSD